MRNMRFARRLMLGAGIAVLAANAAQAAIEEVVVTAQKRSQDVQSVPITVDAFTSEDLRQSNISTINDLQTITPSLFVYTTTAGASDTTFKIRGVGTTGNNPGLEGAVGTFIDGVYRNRSGLALGDLFDVQRIEVLEGPQSTLFGKNTSAGALNIITAAPGPDRAGFIQGEVSSYDGYKVEGWYNLPLSDTLTTRWDGLYDTHSGFVKEVNSGKSINDRDRYFLKGQALWTPTDDVSLRVIADFSHGSEHCCAAIRVFNGPTAAVINGLAVAAGYAPSVADRHTYQESLNGQRLPLTFQDDGISAELNWQLSNSVKLTDIVAYRDFMQSGSGDYDFTGADTLVIPNTGFGDRVFSEELRFTGHNNFESGIKALDWLAGVYYTDEQIRVHTDYQNGTQAGNYWCGVIWAEYTGTVPSGCFTGSAAANTLPNLPPPLPSIPGFAALVPGTGSIEHYSQSGQSWSVFGQATASLTDKLSITAGLRYSHDDKKMNSVVNVTNPAAALFPFWFGNVYDFPGGLTTTSNALTGTANIQYFWTDKIQTYATYSRGYKGGGFNLDRTAGGIIAYNPGGPLNPAYKPEFSDNYEVGLKSKLFGDRVLVNATLFEEKLTNLQVLNYDGVNFHIFNEPKGTSKGFELQTQYSPIDGLLFNAGTTFADTAYGAGSNVPVFNVATQTTSYYDLTGKPFTNAPRWGSSAGATYSFPLLDTGLVGTVHSDVDFTSSRATGTTQEPVKRQTGYALMNARLTVAGGDGNWEAAVWCRNCTNTHYLTVVFDSVGQPGSYDAFVGDPAVYGGTLSYKF